MTAERRLRPPVLACARALERVLAAAADTRQEAARS
jgi:hypothetical protein